MEPGSRTDSIEEPQPAHRPGHGGEGQVDAGHPAQGRQGVRQGRQGQEVRQEGTEGACRQCPLDLRRLKIDESPPARAVACRPRHRGRRSEPSTCAEQPLDLFGDRICLRLRPRSAVFANDSMPCLGSLRPSASAGGDSTRGYLRHRCAIAFNPELSYFSGKWTQR